MPSNRGDDAPAADLTGSAVGAALTAVRERIRAAEHRYGRDPGSVALLAVSKTQPPAAIAAAAAAGQRRFGENYVQEAVTKIERLDPRLEWHFIGPLQSNKTRPVARHFSWVHSLDREKLAFRLSEQRPPGMPPLDVLLQINIDGEASKSGFAVERLDAAAAVVAALPGLRLRGLMTLPAQRQGLSAQREPFARLREALARLRRDRPELRQQLDTLSMGMSADLEAAIAEGATLVRVGTAIFGERPKRR